MTGVEIVALKRDRTSSLINIIVAIRQFCFVFFPSEVELKQQILQKGFQVPSFCGPDADKHANLDCISVSQPDMQDFQNNGKGAMQQVITSSYAAASTN